MFNRLVLKRAVFFAIIITLFFAVFAVFIRDSYYLFALQFMSKKLASLCLGISISVFSLFVGFLLIKISTARLADKIFTEEPSN